MSSLEDRPGVAAVAGRAGSKPLSAFLRHPALPAIVLFIPPALVLFTLFVFLPITEAGYYSVFKWNGFGAPENFVGLRNFERLLGDRHFMTALRNTSIVIAVSLFIQLPLALWLALALSEKTWGVYVFRTLFFLPFILAEVAAGLIWRFVYDGEYGLLAKAFNLLGSEQFFVLGDRTWAVAAIMVVIVWKYFGFHMMIYIAGLQNISREVIEAAVIDGASRWEIIRHVKLPLLRHAIVVSVFFSVIGSLQLFDLIMPMTGGGPSNASHTIVTHLYTFGIVRTRIGFGSAVGVVLFFICVAFTLIYRRAFMRPEH